MTRDERRRAGRERFIARRLAEMDARHAEEARAVTPKYRMPFATDPCRIDGLEWPAFLAVWSSLPIPPEALIWHFPHWHCECERPGCHICAKNRELCEDASE